MLIGEYLSVTQTALLLQMSRAAVHKKIKKGQLEVIKIGNSFVIRTVDVQELILTKDNKSVVVV